MPRRARFYPPYGVEDAHITGDGWHLREILHDCARKKKKELDKRLWMW